MLKAGAGIPPASELKNESMGPLTRLRPLLDRGAPCAPLAINWFGMILSSSWAGAWSPRYSRMPGGQECGEFNTAAR